MNAQNKFAVPLDIRKEVDTRRIAAENLKRLSSSSPEIQLLIQSKSIKPSQHLINSKSEKSISQPPGSKSGIIFSDDESQNDHADVESPILAKKVTTNLKSTSNVKKRPASTSSLRVNKIVINRESELANASIIFDNRPATSTQQISAADEKTTSITISEKEKYLVIKNGSHKLESKSLSSCNSREKDIIIATMLSESNSALAYCTNNNPSDQRKTLKQSGDVKPSISFSNVLDLSEIEKTANSGSRPSTPVRPIIESGTNNMFPLKYIIDFPRSRTQSHGPSHPTSPTSRSPSPSRPGSVARSRRSARRSDKNKVIEYVHVPMSEGDKLALRLGKLLMGSLFIEADLRDSDMLNKFFLDKFLSVYGSSTGATDSFNIDLICEVQNAMMKARMEWPGSAHGSISSKESEQDSRFAPMTRYPSEYKQDDTRLPKAIAAIALETLDVIVKEYGHVNPLFQIIRGAIQPMIFNTPVVSTSEHPTTEDKTVSDDDKQLSKYLEQSTWYEECQAANATIRQLEYKIEFEIQQLLIETKKSESMNKEYDLEVDTRVLAYKSKCEDMLREITSLKKNNDSLVESNKKLKESLRESNAEAKKFKNLYETENQSRIKLGKKVETLDYDLRETNQSNKDMKRKINDLEKHNHSLFSCLEDAHTDVRKMKDDAKATREKFSEALIEKNNTIRELADQVTMAKEVFDSSISSMKSTLIDVFGKNKETAKYKISADSSLELFTKLMEEVPPESEVITPQQGTYIKDWREMFTMEVKELLATRTVMRAELRRMKDGLKQADERCEHQVQEVKRILEVDIGELRKHHEVQLRILLDEIDGKNNEIKQLLSDQLAQIESSSEGGQSDVKVLQDSSGNALSNIQEVIKELKRCQDRIHTYENQLGLQKEDRLLLETRNRLVGYKRDNVYLTKEVTALRQELEAINDKFLESKRRTAEKENRIKIEQDRERMNTTMKLENLQEEIGKLTAENARASEKTVSLDMQISALRGNIAAVSLNLGKAESQVVEKNRALQISEICLMEIDDRLSKDALNTVKKRDGRMTRRSSVMRSSFMPVFFDTDYKEVEIGLRSDKKWEIVQERIQLEKVKVATLSVEFREEATLIKQELQNFEKIFGVVTQLLVTQVMITNSNHSGTSGNALVAGQLPTQQQLQSRTEKQAEEQAKLQEKLQLTAKIFANLGHFAHAKPNNAGTQTIITEFPEFDEKFQADEKFAKFLKVSGHPKDLSQPFLGFIRKNEKILAREVGYMRVLSREFKGVYDAARYNLKKMILAMPPKSESKLLRAVSKGIIMIKKTLDESAWMFEPHQFDKRIKTAEKDPVDVYTQNRIIKPYEEELSAAAANGTSLQVQSALRDLLEDLRNKAGRSGGWAAALYLEDGSIDLDMDEAPWPMREQLEIARIKLKYSQYIHEQRELDYTAIIERLKSVASAVAGSPANTPIQKNSSNSNINNASSVGSESEPLEFMHSIINVAMAKERMNVGVGLMSTHGSIANLTKDGSMEDYLEHDIIAMKEATLKIQRLEAAVVEATAVLLPILDQIDDRLDDVNFRNNIKRSEHDVEFSFADTVDGDDLSEVSDEDIVDKIMSKAVRDIGKEGIASHGKKEAALSKDERLRRDELIHHQRREAFLERDKLLNQLEKKSKSALQNLQREREFIPRPCSSVGARRAELQPHLQQPLLSTARSNAVGTVPKRAISAGPARERKQKLLPLPLQQGQTGNKSFVDNNTHDGWRQFESQLRHERAKSMQDNGVESVSPLSPVVISLRAGEKKEVSFVDEQDVEVMVEKLLSICAALKERSNPLKPIRGGRKNNELVKPIRERPPESRDKRPRTSQPSIDTATIQDRRIFRDAVHEDYKKCINEASRLKALMNNLDVTIGRVTEGKAEEKSMLSVHKEDIKNHYNSKLLFPSRLSNAANVVVSRDLITMTDTMFSESTVTSIHDVEAGSATDKHSKFSLPHLI